MRKHDHMKNQHAEKSTQPATTGVEMVSAKLDLAAEKITTAGHFKVSIASQTTPVRINHMHDRVFALKKHGGNPISGAKMS